MAMINTGYLEYSDLKDSNMLPTDERYMEGPVAVIECIQEIPCNPCEASCKFGAIEVGEPITNLPRLISNKCIGCGVCVAKCSGMAIFIVNKVYTETTASIGFPYEYFPLPEKGEKVSGVNRKGEVVCEGKVISVMNPKSFDHTPVVTIEIPKKYADEVRSMARR